MSNLPIIIVDIDGAANIGELLPDPEARERLLNDVLKEEEVPEQPERWDLSE